MAKLTIKQEKFCNKLLECGVAAEAYRYAYNCSKMKEKSVWEKASELLSNVNVSSRVKELQEEQRKKSDITKEKVLSEFAKIAFSSISHLHNTWIERKEFEELTDDQKSCIKNISTKVQKRPYTEIDESGKLKQVPYEVEYVKIELYDKIKALENINKMLGFEAPEKSILTIESERLTESERKKLIDKL